MTTNVAEKSVVNSIQNKVFSSELTDQRCMLNPLVNESLNNLVKRFDRSKVPKPPLTKGHNLLKKKSKNFSSVPNIFFCSTDKFVKLSKSEKKCPWTNKINFDFEKLKNAFKSNYDTYFNQRKRSSSIPILNREADVIDTITDQNSNELKLKIVSENISKKQIKPESKNKMDAINSAAPKLDKPDSVKSNTSINSDNLEANSDKPSFSKHVFLDGAIIEPISPASLSKEDTSSSLPVLVVGGDTKSSISCDKEHDELNKAKEEMVLVEKMEKEIVIKGKRGRKKKINKNPKVSSLKKNLESVVIETTTNDIKDNKTKIVEDNKQPSSSITQETTQVINEEPIVEIPPIQTKIKKKRGRKPKQKEILPTVKDSLEEEESVTNFSTSMVIPDEKSLAENNIEKIEKEGKDNKELSDNLNTIINEQLSIINEEKLKEKLIEEEPKSNNEPDIQPVDELSVSNDSKIIINEPDKAIDNSDVIVTPVLEREYKDHVSPQSNDLELLSNSISNSVDTSMLPPRKRYKRFMYLESNKQISPKVSESEENKVNTPEVVEEKEESKEVINIDKEVSCAKPMVTKTKSKKKRISQPSTTKDKSNKISRQSKKSTSDNETLKPEIKDIIDPVIEEAPIIDQEDKTLSEEVTSVTSSEANKSTTDSLKRSKREAAARGFANMVAMSLNNNTTNSTVNQDTSSEAGSKKANSLKLDLEDVSLTEQMPAVTSKKSKKGKIKSESKQSTKASNKRSSTNSNTPSLKEPEKPIAKKQKLSIQKEKGLELSTNPSSPQMSVASNDTSLTTTSKYRRIRTNNYIDPKPQYWFEEVEKCGCKPSKFRNLYEPKTKSQSGVSNKKKPSNIVWDCGDNCLNRLVYTECLPKQCPCGDDCSNQRIRRGEWVQGLKLVDISGKGKGVITKNLVKEGTFITEYVGDVVNESTFHQRMNESYNSDAHHYCLHLDSDMLIDAYRCGSIARFINHNCQPNCEMQKWLVNGAYRMCIFASQDIAPDTELCYDYNFCSYNNDNVQPCLCGAPNCRGFIGSKPRPQQTQQQKIRQRLMYIFGRLLNPREKLFVMRHSIFLLRNRDSGRCRRLGIRNNRYRHGNRVPSTITEIKRRKTRKNQFLTQLSALNSIRSMRTRQLVNAQDNELLTRTAQLGQILRDLYNSLLEQKDPIDVRQQLVLPFINALNRKKYTEFYRMVGWGDSVSCLNDVQKRLLDGEYSTMLEFDQDILTIFHKIELYAGKQSQIGKCAERAKPIYKELKQNSIALYEALFEQPMDEKDVHKLLSNNLYQVSQAVVAMKGDKESNKGISLENISITNLSTSTSSGNKGNKKRKPIDNSNINAISDNNTSINSNIITTTYGNSSSGRGRMERGAEVIKCVCGYQIEAGHVMVQCDRCFVWQHAYCMNVAYSSSQSMDVTCAEPYYCHICSPNANQELILEIPRYYHISDESVNDDESSSNRLFWTLYSEKCQTLLKIDDFVFISSQTDSENDINNKTQRTVMRIYSLWKDKNNQRWMEGGIFLRPYDTRLSELTDKTSSKPTNQPVSLAKRRASKTNLWHPQELVYTELTEILPLERVINQCFVLNNHTFKQGRPISSLLSNNINTIIDCVFVCDWMVDSDGRWSELDPAYLKINTKPYCFEKWSTVTAGIPTNNDSEDNNSLLQYIQRKFERQYTTEDLLQLDQGKITNAELEKSKGLSPQTSVDEREKVQAKERALEKLISKLYDFAQDRNQKLPPSSTPSSVSSSRGSSPLVEDVGTGKSPMRQDDSIDYTIRRGSRRKQLIPHKRDVNFTGPMTRNLTRKSTNQQLEESENEEKVTNLSEGQSPQLMIVTDEDKSEPHKELQPLSVEENLSTKTDSTPKVDEQSNMGSEINFGELADLLKDKKVQENIRFKEDKLETTVNNVLNTPDIIKQQKKKSIISNNSVKSTPKTSPNKKPIQSKSPKKATKKPTIIPTSRKVVSTSKVLEESDRCLRTRNKRTIMTDDFDEDEFEPALKIPNMKLDIQNNNDKSSGNNAESLKEVKKSSLSDDDNIKDVEMKSINDANDNNNDCFVKLERIKMKNDHKQKDILKDDKIDDMNKQQSEQNVSFANLNVNTTLATNTTSISSSENNSSNNIMTNISNNTSNSSTLSNRSKRKKGVPKRIPIDFNYPATPTNSTIPSVGLVTSSVKPSDENITKNDKDETTNEYVVDLSSSGNTTNNFNINSNTTTTNALPLISTNIAVNNSSNNTITPVEIVPTQPQQRPTPVKTNDFSSIENISSD